MVKAIRIHETGGPEVLKLETVELPAPGPGQARVRHTAIGLNYIDTYHRSGLYPVPMPSGIGLEAAGIVEAIGEGVSEVKVGDRVAYGSGPLGAYAEAQNCFAAGLIKLPDTIKDDEAAALMMKGLTTRYLFKETFKVQKGDTVLFHAAAGGVGLVACQWAKHLGVNLIGTAGSDEKCALAKSHGAAHVINYRTENVVERVMEITDGKKVPVVYDGVGKDTFIMSLDCLQPRGLLASFGNASGAVTGVDLGILAAKGSLYVTRPTMIHYMMTPAERTAATTDLFDVVASGAVKVDINQRYALADAAQAHRDIEARATTGATIIEP
ncbi:MAG: quinone oxidoreductase [Alphaproteobacteria bacterium]|nr:quinone oxidoreductase [Alphaproteobacteria bacterium]MBO6626949.1 quinone oxidoreductase [Alphaproteobacteria bacterium]MDF1627716.1 quinone oxidoreductase [Parvibaculaceae bacterium]